MSGIIAIRRMKVDPQYGIFGEIWYNQTRIGVTVEKLWDNNKKGVSCIPVGEYDIFPHDTAQHPSVVAFRNHSLKVYLHESDIPKGTIGRSECLIHSANFASELQGCVAVGREVADFGNGRMGVTSSRETLNKLRSFWGDRTNLRAVIQREY